MPIVPVVALIREFSPRRYFLKLGPPEKADDLIRQV